MKKVLVVATVVLVLSMAIPLFAQAQAISVWTHNNTYCQFDYDGNIYYGPGTRVTFEDGTVNQQCNMKLIDGSPVSSTTQFVIDYDLPEFTAVCYFTVTPAGNMNVHCHG